MKITVVGAGAMGSLFGGLLAEAGNDVWFVDVWDEHVNVVNEEGLTIEKEAKDRIINVKATTNPSQAGVSDLIIIFVKSNQTGSAARTASGLMGSDSLVLTLQNGMGNADSIAGEIDPKRIIAGTTSHGATMLGPGKIRHAGTGLTVIGMWADGDTEQAVRIADIFRKAGIDCDVVENVKNVIWDKLIVNVGINAITALTGIKNGQILDMESTVGLLRAAVEEAVHVAKVKGIQVREKPVEHVLQIARATGANRSSMGQDIDNRRQTEIKAINGVIVKEGQKLGINTPVNETLTVLIETLQGHLN